jgi:translation initiation factor IF-2
LTKVRIYELARELNLGTKEIIQIAGELGFEVKNHMSNLDAGQAEQVRAKLAKKSEKTEPKPAKKPEKVEPKPAKKPKPAPQKAGKPAKRTGSGKPPAKKGETRKPAQPVQIAAAGHTVAELEKLFKLPATQLIKALMSLGVMANINQQLDTDTIEILAAQLGVDVEVQPSQEEKEKQIFAEMKTSTAEDAQERSPVVTVMGHVDHGKTSLLDAIRHANVTASEAGGITQHIGAYQVEHNGKKIVFLDTPGHEAFTAMRARGTKVTDVAVLVVAADEGVMPQTVEALNHAKAADVPIIVALNKMDKPAANPDRVKQQLSNHGLMPEDWGGDTIYVEVSALTGQGIDDLLEMILLSAEMLELKASVNRPALGTVIEAKLDKGRGPVATILIQQGTLSVGDSVVCGSAYGKVRAMFNDRGQRIQKSGPSVPVEVLGLSDVPPAGEIFQAVDDDKTARLEAQGYSQEHREVAMAKTRVTLEDIYKQMENAQIRELNLVLKSDVHGTTEALKQSLGKIKVADIKVNIIHDGVGAINLSDVMLASASGAIIIGFNVRPDANAQKLADEEKVEIRLYRVIYDVIDDVKRALEGLLEPEFREAVIGRAEVRNIFRHSKLGTIAGCYIIDGKVTSRANGRLLRDGVIIHEGRLASLKRFKEDVREVSSGYECGIMFENYNDIKEGDHIEAYVMVEEK